MWIARNIWYFFLVPGLLLLLAGVVRGFETAQFGRTADRAEGSVISNRWVTDSDGNGTYHPEVRFEASDKQPYTFVSQMGSSPATFKVGDRVPVLYEISQPQKASIDRFSDQWFSSIMLSAFGVVFTLLGGIPILVRTRKAKKTAWLQLNGQAVQADFTGAPKRTDYEVNGRNPYRITAQWKNAATNEVRSFKSQNLWFDPAPYITGKTITVLVDPNNPKRYWMDLTFLPNADK